MPAQNYKPCFTDPRTRRRITVACGFVRQYLRTDKPSALGTRYIDRFFGIQSNALSKYLRTQLLICCDTRYNKDLKITKKYLLNADGLNYLEHAVGIANNTEPVPLTVTVKFKQELADGIVYKDSSSRRWHWLQNQRRADKRRILADSGLTHNYDIQCSCPTLLLQYSQQLPEIVDYTTIITPLGQQPRFKLLSGPMDQYLSYLEDYLKNRQQRRLDLAEQAQVDVNQIKRIINGLFQGGILTTYTKSNCWLELDGDRAVIEFLQQHEFIIGLKADIKTMWSYIKAYKDPRRPGNKWNGRHKTALYRMLERQVLDQVEVYLNETNNQYYLEHDGWTTKKQIDLQELNEFITSKTGFNLKFDYELLNSDAGVTGITA
jgi:hypothetical protein